MTPPLASSFPPSHPPPEQDLRHLRRLQSQASFSLMSLEDPSVFAALAKGGAPFFSAAWVDGDGDNPKVMLMPHSVHASSRYRNNIRD
jgi:hypothetical protein